MPGALDTEELDPEEVAEAEEHTRRREELAKRLADGELEEAIVEIELIDNSPSPLTIMGPQGADAMGIDTTALQAAMGRTPMTKTKTRRLTVAEARKAIANGMVKGGMIPKLEESIRMLEKGAVGAIHVVGGLGPGDLLEALRRPGAIGTALLP